MKIASLALASTLAAVVLSAQPVLAQNPDSIGSSNASSSENGGGMKNGGAMSSGEDQSGEREGNWRGQRAQDATGARAGGMGWHHGGRFAQDGRGMRKRMMERHHEMMMGAMRGARIRLSRGNARIDVECPPRSDMKACVDAAAELLDKVAGLHRKAEQQGATSGSAVTPPASGSDESGQAPDMNNDDQDQNLDRNPTPNNPGERM